MNGNIGSQGVTQSGSGAIQYGGGYAVRPIVEVDLSKVDVVKTGTGTRTNPYSMAKK